MTHDKTLRFYLDEDLKTSAEKGAHNFIGKVAGVAQAAGFDVEYHTNSLASRHASADLGGYAMFHMDAPTHARALTMRRAYYYPFWQIETSAKRWDWRVAKTPFEVGDVDRDVADRFFKFWRKRLFANKADRPTHDGYVYVPLQGRLTEHRSFQTCSPIKMIEHTLAQDTFRKVVATLHPNEAYSKDELETLETLAKQHTRLTVRTGGMEELLAGCDYVVTQNSSAGFTGFLFQKPCITFAKIDFHHMTAHVPDIGIEHAFGEITEMQPDYAGYVWWFLQKMSINAGRPEAEDDIRAALIRSGWPM